jgi:hypothetical protein
MTFPEAVIRWGGLGLFAGFMTVLCYDAREWAGPATWICIALFAIVTGVCVLAVSLNIRDRYLDALAPPPREEAP